MSYVDTPVTASWAYFALMTFTLLCLAHLLRLALSGDFSYVRDFFRPWLITAVTLLVLFTGLAAWERSRLPQAQPLALPDCSQGRVELPRQAYGAETPWVVLSNGDLLHLSGQPRLWRADAQPFTLSYRGWNKEMSALGLPGGQVLLAGAKAQTDSGIGAELQVYAPCRQEVVRRVPMAVAREGATLLRLNAQQALLLGGYEVSEEERRLSARVELIDLEDFSSTALPSMQAPRYRPVALLLADGRLLVLGGEDEAALGRQAQRAEVFDFTSRQWRPGGELKPARRGLSAQQLADGRVLALGQSIGEPASQALLWHPGQGQWSPGPEPLAGRLLHLLPGPQGSVLAAGDGAGPERLHSDGLRWYPLSTPDVHDAVLLRPWGPEKLAWLRPEGALELQQGRKLSVDWARLAQAGGEAAAELALPSGLVLKVGGFKSLPGQYRYDDVDEDACDEADCDEEVAPGLKRSATSFALGLTRLYSPKEEQWSLGLPLNLPRSGHVLRALPDGRVLALGGLGRSRREVLPAELWHPQTLGWSVLPELLINPHQAGRSLVLADGSLLFFEDDGLLVAIKRWDGKQVATLGQLPRRRIHFASWRVPDGRVLIFGGLESSSSLPEAPACAGCPARQVSVDAPNRPAPALVWDMPSRSFVPTTGPQFLLLPQGQFLAQTQEQGLVRFEADRGSLVFDPQTLQWSPGE